MYIHKLHAYFVVYFFLLFFFACYLWHAGLGDCNVMGLCTIVICFHLLYSFFFSFFLPLSSWVGFQVSKKKGGYRVSYLGSLSFS
jgi:hypothetical protein